MRLQIECALLVLTMLLAGRANSQVFRVQGGTSTMLNAQGGSVEFKAPKYDGSVNLGYFEGHLRFGAENRYQFQSFTLLTGDETVPFILPTDVFDASHYFSVRGIGVTHKDSIVKYYAFGGTTSTWLGTGLFNAATSDDPVGMLFYERKINDHFKFFSRNIVSRQQTFLQGLEYQPNRSVKASLTAGMGSNQRYFAASLDAETQKLIFRTSYVLTGNSFQRISLASPLSSEVNKGNVQMLYKPLEFVALTAGHQNLLEPITLGGAMQQASVNQLSADFHAEKFYFGSGLFSSSSSGLSTQGTNLYVGRRFGRLLEVNENWFQSKSQGQPSSRILSGTIRENFSSRMSLLQLISRTNGQTTFAFGGDLTSNRLMLQADYQNIYLPFRPDHPFQQALALNASVRVVGPMQITAASNVDPTGHLRYTFGMSTYVYRMSGMTSAHSESFSIAKFLVQGLVKDDHGNPVEGAALHIGKEVVYSDSTGAFLVRMGKHGPFPLSVVPDEFIINGVFETVSAPTSVRAETEDAAANQEIVIRRVPPQPMKTMATKQK
ncbi:hypothetical protein P8935_12125 [Telmatobacter sp. DSM 110680]|uniref:Carboxypeptidase regulatory-like domain-containing protein n=1 Tax=Telmatobacter sp. DSM 110680 TaxID=3036704 RepID=A0AAU7DTG9_9BACT